MSEVNYFKDVKKSIFYLDMVPTLVVAFLICLVVYIMFFVTLHILFDKNFILGDYLPQKLRSYETIGFSLGCLISIFLDIRRNYRMAKKKPFAFVNNDRLILNFGRDSFLWDSIQSVDVEGERKLTIAYYDEERTKKKVNDLKWLSKKEDFIYNLENTCSGRNISCGEADMTYSSRIIFYLITILIQSFFFFFYTYCSGHS